MDSRNQRLFDEWKQSNSRSRINGAIVTADYTRNPYVARRGLLYSRNYTREPRLNHLISKPLVCQVQGRAKQPIASRRCVPRIRQMFNIDATTSVIVVVSCCTWLPRFLHTNVSVYASPSEKRNAPIFIQRYDSSKISILLTEWVGSKPLSLDSSSWKRMQLAILLHFHHEEIYVFHNSIENFSVRQNKRKIARSAYVSYPETKRSRINAKIEMYLNVDT